MLEIPWFWDNVVDIDEPNTFTGVTPLQSELLRLGEPQSRDINTRNLDAALGCPARFVERIEPAHADGFCSALYHAFHNK